MLLSTCHPSACRRLAAPGTRWPTACKIVTGLYGEEPASAPNQTCACMTVCRAQVGCHAAGIASSFELQVTPSDRSCSYGIIQCTTLVSLLVVMCGNCYADMVWHEWQPTAGPMLGLAKTLVARGPTHGCSDAACKNMQRLGMRHRRASP